MTNTELANMALSHIGKVPINDINANLESAEICKLFILPARQLFLKQSKLYLSRKEQALALAAGEVSNIYTYIYGLPSDCMSPIKIWNGNLASPPVLYEIGTHSSLTSSVIKTDYQNAILIYSVDIVNLNVYTMSSIIAMSYLLASLIAMPLKVDERLAAKSGSDYLLALSVAVADDKNAQSIDVVNNSRFTSIEDSRKT